MSAAHKEVIYPPRLLKRVNSRRNSSVELFRILATFFVLITHLNGWMVGGIADTFDTGISLPQRIGQLTIASLTVVCVNCFLIISGWYGVKLKFASLWKMWTLLVCIYLPFQLAASCYSGQFSFAYFVVNLLAFVRESYFVQCYLMLLFLSPMLNSFVEKYGKRILPYVLVFWMIEFVFESLFHNKSLHFEQGYSLIHFVLMYMLARAFSYYQEDIKRIVSGWWLLGYFVCAAVVVMMHLAGFDNVWAYSNPVVVAESFCLFFPFLYGSFVNRTINQIASSAFAVYIMHTCSPLFVIIQKVDVHLLNNYSYYIYLPAILSFALVVFVVCIVYDRLRLRITTPLFDWLGSKVERKVRSFFIYG